MELKYTQVSQIPPFAYAARVRGATVEVLHGSRLERTQRMFCDGAWAGSFAAARPDRGFIAGTAGLLIDGGLRLVSANCPTDRVFVVTMPDEIIASNSLPFVLSLIDDELDVTDLTYRSRFVSTIHGLHVGPRSFRSARGRTIHLMLDQLADIRDGTVNFTSREPVRPFGSYADYVGYLSSTVQACVENASDPARQFTYLPLSALSGGYDSCASAALMVAAGGNEAVTLLRWDRERPSELVDYPSEVADQLGLTLHDVQRDTWHERTDLPDAEVAAASTNFIDIPLIALEPHLPGRMLFVGNSGDNVWSKKNFRDYPDVVRGDTSGQGFGEYRLRVGFILLPVPYIGHTAHPSIRRITLSDEMAPWTIGGDYDRPIPRRIVEERGVARSAFGQRKYAGGALVGSSNEHFDSLASPESIGRLSRFMTAEGVRSFRQFVDERKPRSATRRLRFYRAGYWVYGKVDAVNFRVGRRGNSVGIRAVVPRALVARLAARFSVYPDITYLFPHWGTWVLKRRYDAALERQ